MARFRRDVLLKTVRLQALNLIDKNLVRTFVQMEGQRLPQAISSSTAVPANSSVAMVLIAS
jgi:hypothetical protein